jgi:acyl dehydratase
VAAGTGEIYSYVVHHHPPVPGRQAPFVVALVQLTEGVRVVAELLGVPPDQVRIGMPVQADFVCVDDELTLPAWRPLPSPQPGAAPAAGPATGGPAEPAGQALPELVIDVTPTQVIAAAIATRDYQDVHHDRDAAVRRGSKDIFVNILTTTGLVQRYVTDWAGPQALVRSVAIRLGVPCYAGDTLRFSGRAAPGEVPGELVVRVTGRCSLGDHVTGTVRVVPAGGAS